MIGKFAHLTDSFMNLVAYILLIPEFPRAISELICFNRPYDALEKENTRARNQGTQTPSLATSHGN